MKKIEGTATLKIKKIRNNSGGERERILGQSHKELKPTPRWSVRKNSMEFFSVFGLLLICFTVGLCTEFLCSHDLLECSTLT